jgi:hypothetical protein
VFRFNVVLSTAPEAVNLREPFTFNAVKVVATSDALIAVTDNTFGLAANSSAAFLSAAAFSSAAFLSAAAFSSAALIAVNGRRVVDWGFCYKMSTASNNRWSAV